MSSTFAALGVSEPVSAALAKRGIERPFAVQSMVVPDVLDGHDVLVKSPTGSGKTLAFGVPMADLVDPDGAWPSALVLAPTRELAAQIVDELAGVMHAGGLRSPPSTAASASTTRPSRPAARTCSSRRPGRLLDLIERGAVRLDDIDLLVLDEADRMLDMGFKPAVDRIVRHDAARPPDAAVLRDSRGRGRADRRRLHARRRTATRSRRRPRRSATSSTASGASRTRPR